MMELQLLMCFIVSLLLPCNILLNTINRPLLCSNAMWNANGSLIDRINPLNRDIQTFFIDYNNRIFLGDISDNEVYVWSDSPTSEMNTIVLENQTRPTSIFKYGISDLYIAMAGATNRITRWTPDLLNETLITSTDEFCWGLYVTRDTLFCTLSYSHQVMIFRLESTSRWTVDRGEKGVCGAASTELCFPTGIFWLNDFSLYVADTNNDRIQMFRYDDLDAKTEVGSSGTMMMTLSKPTAVIADGLASLIIADSGNERIVRCQAWSSCVSIIEKSDTQLPVFQPSHLTFDRFGNLYSMAQSGGLVHKFDLEKNDCYQYILPSLGDGAEWDINATTVLGRETFSGTVRTIFINHDNHLYTYDYVRGQIMVVSLMDNNITKMINATPYEYSDLFIGLDGDIYFEQKNQIGSIYKWSVSRQAIIPVFKFSGSCFGLFIDTSSRLYCSQSDSHRVVRISLNQQNESEIVVAGTGMAGSGSDQFFRPSHIFIDLQNNLYVVDTENARIQRFRKDNRTGATIAGRGIPSGLMLYYPIDVIVDRNNSLYIAENENHRIIRVTQERWRCLVGCEGIAGPEAHQLHKPLKVQLDRAGNLYVADEYNYRVQRFELISDGSNVNLSNCSSPIVAIQPSESHLTFHPNEDIYFTATIQWPCPSIPNHSIQWYLESMSNNFSSFFSTTSNDQIEFHFPSQNFLDDQYLLNFTIEVNGTARVISVISYIKIKSSDAPLKLIEENATDIDHFIERSLHLNPIPNLEEPQKWIFRYSYRFFSSNSSFQLFDDLNQSSLIIQPYSLLPNQTYQFMLELIDRNASDEHFVTYLRVHTQSMRSGFLKIGSLIQRKSPRDSQFFLMNRYHQLTLFLLDLNRSQTIEWQFFEGHFDTIDRSVQWRLFNSTGSSLHSSLFEKNLTISKEFFETYRFISHWRFRIISQFNDKADFDLDMNDPPSNGSCSISPLSGDTLTLFTIECQNWFDQHGLEDYSFLGHFSSSSNNIIFLLSTPNSTTRLLLPAKLNPSETFSLTVAIRDTFGCVTEFLLPSISMITDLNTINSFSHPLLTSIYHSDQNIAAPLIHSFLQIFNEINDEYLRLAEQENISVAHITIAPLHYPKNFNSNLITNISLIELQKYISIRNLFMKLISNWSINDLNHQRLQSSLLAQLTQTLSQLSPDTSILASKKCLTLALTLSTYLNEISFEDLQMISNDLLQCSTNSLMAGYGPLQNRLRIDDIDREEQIFWAREIHRQHDQTIHHLTFLLGLHLNNNQSLNFDTNSIYFSLKKQSNQLIRNLTVPMALLDDEYSSTFTNLSRSHSLDLIDENGQMIRWKNSTMEFFISHDPLLRVPPMILYNLTTSTDDYRYHLLNLSHLNPELNYSIHLEFSPIEKNFSFSIIYHFNPRPSWKSADGFDGSMDVDLHNDIYSHVINPFIRSKYSSIVYGIRSFNRSETNIEYYLRFFLSACYYLDEHFRWRSDGLTIGPQTNHHQTQCLSFH